ncbi:hypothetical protein DFP72DRAFT_894598, partial [Ephemerocybe angulata]
NRDNWDALSIIGPSSSTQALDSRYGSGIEVPFQPVLRDFLEEAVDAYRRHLSESESLEARSFGPGTWYTFKFGKKEQRKECSGAQLVGDIKKGLFQLASAEVLAEGRLEVRPAKGKPFSLDDGKSLNQHEIKYKEPIWFVPKESKSSASGPLRPTPGR